MSYCPQCAKLLAELEVAKKTLTEQRTYRIVAEVDVTVGGELEIKVHKWRQDVIRREYTQAFPGR